MDKSEKKSFFLGYRKLAASDPCQGLPSSPLTTHPDLPLLTPPPCSRRKENSKERQLFMKKTWGQEKPSQETKKRRGVAQKKTGLLLLPGYLIRAKALYHANTFSKNPSQTSCDSKIFL